MAAGKKVTRSVVARNEDGQSQWLHPGDTVPSGFTVDNPKAFEDDTDVPLDEVDPLEQQDYDRLEVKDLKKLASERGLDTKGLGTKAELVHALTLNDAGLS